MRFSRALCAALGAWLIVLVAPTTTRAADVPTLSEAYVVTKDGQLVDTLTVVDPSRTMSESICEPHVGSSAAHHVKFVTRDDASVCHMQLMYSRAQDESEFVVHDSGEFVLTARTDQTLSEYRKIFGSSLALASVSLSIEGQVKSATSGAATSATTYENRSLSVSTWSDPVPQVITVNGSLSAGGNPAAVSGASGLKDPWGATPLPGGAASADPAASPGSTASASSDSAGPSVVLLVALIVGLILVVLIGVISFYALRARRSTGASSGAKDSLPASHVRRSSSSNRSEAAASSAVAPAVAFAPPSRSASGSAAPGDSRATASATPKYPERGYAPAPVPSSYPNPAPPSRQPVPEPAPAAVPEPAHEDPAVSAALPWPAHEDPSAPTVVPEPARETTPVPIPKPPAPPAPSAPGDVPPPVPAPRGGVTPVPIPEPPTPPAATAVPGPARDAIPAPVPEPTPPLPTDVPPPVPASTSVPAPSDGQAPIAVPEAPAAPDATAVPGPAHDAIPAPIPEPAPIPAPEPDLSLIEDAAPQPKPEPTPAETSSEATPAPIRVPMPPMRIRPRGGHRPAVFPERPARPVPQPPTSSAPDSGQVDSGAGESTQAALPPAAPLPRRSRSSRRAVEQAVLSPHDGDPQIGSEGGARTEADGSASRPASPVPPPAIPDAETETTLLPTIRRDNFAEGGVIPPTVPTPAPAGAPEAFAEPAPVVEPVAEPEPFLEPEPVVEPEPIAEPEPVVEPEPAPEPEAAPEHGDTFEPEPAPAAEPPLAPPP
ncbi:hypothetical protein, partial [Kytococcus sedentarius]|uniref:hypothetical protein n=1 Tax=Kytococcus sedentarius TaxID=1276 RepID=UPI000661050D